MHHLEETLLISANNAYISLDVFLAWKLDRELIVLVAHW